MNLVKCNYNEFCNYDVLVVVVIIVVSCCFIEIKVLVL